VGQRGSEQRERRFMKSAEGAKCSEERPESVMSLGEKRMEK
jgi:hypothetical protein